MKLSYQWLKQWVDVQVLPEVLAEQLTAAGLEVEECLRVADEFTGVVIAEVRQVERHPQADKLSVCQVSTGDGKIHTVVCGAQNVVAGCRVPYAQVGAVIGTQKAEPKKIAAATLRNVDSAGMLCSAADLGMAETSEGLLLLPNDAPLGADVYDYLKLDDTVLDVQLTPNRGDCLSVLGVAREAGAIQNLPVQKMPAIPISIKHQTILPVQIQARQACLRYAGRVITQVNNKISSPVWLQEALRRAGVRSISTVVDVMNYVMLEIGQPLHAFDLEKVDQEIQVRFAQAGETLTLLDEQTVTLQPNVLIIADKQKALAMAGIMGGLESAVSTDTHAIFIESAFFTQAAIQGRARQYGLQTDASYRFERGVDPLLPIIALERATELLLAITGGEAGPLVEADTETPWQPVTIDLTSEKLQRLLGVSLPEQEVSNILQRLGMQVVKSATGWKIQPPSFRFDMQIPEDVVEEIARIYGYTRLPANSSRLIMHLPYITQHLTAEQFAEILVGRGYQEVITYSFIDPALQALCEPEQKALALANPIASDLAVMRTSILPGLLSALQYNANRQQDRIRCFEHGLCFVENAGALAQQTQMAGIISGNLLPENWQKPEKKTDFYALKSDVLALLSLNKRLAEFTIIPASHSSLHPGQCAAIVYKGGVVVGYLGAIHPYILQTLGIKNAVYGFELQLNSLVTHFTLPRYQPLSRFPTVRRDLAIVIKEEVKALEVERIVRKVADNLLQDFCIFDVYRGTPIAKGFKSLALGLTLQASDRTLIDTEVDILVKEIVSALAQTFNAELRE